MKYVYVLDDVVNKSALARLLAHSTILIKSENGHQCLLEGGRMSQYQHNWLAANHIRIIATFEVEEMIEPLPPIPEGVRPFYPPGGYGGNLFVKHLTEHPTIPILITTTSTQQELVVRRHENLVYLVFFDKEFTILVIEYSDIARLTGGTGIAVWRKLHRSVQGRSIIPKKYIGVGSAMTYDDAAGIMNWRWREE